MKHTTLDLPFYSLDTVLQDTVNKNLLRTNSNTIRSPITLFDSTGVAYHYERILDHSTKKLFVEEQQLVLDITYAINIYGRDHINPITNHAHHTYDAYLNVERVKRELLTKDQVAEYLETGKTAARGITVGNDISINLFGNYTQILKDIEILFRIKNRISTE